MNRKLASVILLAALVAIALVAAIPAAADEPVYIFPFEGGPYVVGADDEISLGWYWWATTPGLVNVYIKATEVNYALIDSSGQIVWSLSAKEAEGYWAEPFPIDLSDFFDYPMPYIYISDWQYPLGKLPPGTYTLATEFTLMHPVNDGAHVLLDPVTGERVYPTPSIYLPGTTLGAVTIIVE